MKEASATLTTRVPVSLADKAVKASDRKRDPYAPSVSALLARGLELALQELERKRPSKS